MTEILVRLMALCALAAVSEQMTEGNALRDGVQLIAGLLAARLILEAVYALPGALFP